MAKSLQILKAFFFLKMLSAVQTMANLVNFDVGGQRIKCPFTA